jgi:hypothetical protein
MLHYKRKQKNMQARKKVLEMRAFSISLETALMIGVFRESRHVAFACGVWRDLCHCWLYAKP